MKKLLILTLLLISFSSYSYISNKQIRVVYNKLIKLNHLVSAPQLKIISLPRSSKLYSNAWSSGFGIYLTKGMIKEIKNLDEVAKVLSHELGHHFSNHLLTGHWSEFEADYVGAQYMKKAGYNVCRGAQEFKRRNYEECNTHPSDMARYKALGCY